MADDKKTLKFQMMMSPSEADELDDWMFKNRIRSRAEAIRRLWQIGLLFDERQRDLIKRSERALKALIVTFEKVSKADVEKMPKSVRAGLKVAIEEQSYAYKAVSEAGIAHGLLSKDSGESEDLLRQAKDFIALLDTKQGT